MNSYDPSVFDVDSIEDAMAIILTPEGVSTEERWAKETAWLVPMMIEKLAIGPDSLVIDYGCGIGRLARELIAATGCWVIGVDISPSMRALAQVYVGNSRFLAVAPEALDNGDMIGKADAAICVWALQHASHPAREVSRLDARLRLGARVFLLNNIWRAVPTPGGWANDGIDIAAMVGAAFKPLETGKLPPEAAPQALADATFWGVYRKAV